MNEHGDSSTTGSQGLESPSTRDDAVRMVAVGNAALVGIPAAYVTSGSMAVTALAAAVAVLLVALYLHRRRCR